MHRQLLTLTLTAAVLAIAGTVQAALIVQPTDADATSEFGGGRTAVDAINASGFTTSEADTVETDDPIPSPWPDHNNGAKLGWVSGGGTTVADQAITFDLGQVYDLTGIRVWNYNVGGFTDRGIKDLDVEFSTTGTDLSSASGFSKVGDFTFSQAPGTNTYQGEDHALSGQARFVRFDIETNYGSNLVGLSEVRFTAIPEPATLALLGLGGAVMLGGRRRRG